MTDSIGCISIRTGLISEQNERSLYALRNVLYVAQTPDGYLVVLEKAIKEDYVEDLFEAIKSFEFVEDVSSVEKHVASLGAILNSSKYETKLTKISEAVKELEPKLEDYGNDFAQFAVDIRRWSDVAAEIRQIMLKSIW